MNPSGWIITEDHPTVSRVGDTRGPQAEALVAQDYSWVASDVRDRSSNILSDVDVADLQARMEISEGGGEDFNYSLCPCDPVERICHGRVDKEPPFIYMYEDLFTKIGVRLPLTEFEAEVLRVLNLAPSQLHPNGWGFVRAFERLSGTCGVEVSAFAFWYFFRPVNLHKGGWVSLSGRNEKILVAYDQSFKGFKGKFFRIEQLTNYCGFLGGFGGNPEEALFPLTWQRCPRKPPSPEFEDLTPEDQAVVRVFREKLLGNPGSCAEILSEDRPPLPSRVK